MMAMPIPNLIFAVVISAALLAGCSGGEASQGNAAGERATTAMSAKADPCSLLSAADIEDVVGDKVTKTERDGDYCNYQTSDQDGAEVQYVVGDAKGRMDIDRKVGGAMGDMGRAIANEGAAGADANAMMHDGGGDAAIGDVSLFIANGGVSFRKGDQYVSITPPIMHDPMTAKGNPLIGKDDKRAMAVALARKALAKLH